ncbi:hypothetical protein MKW94_000310 [Papaver nudicaule]|uniref:Uncharacterized protein n=1 Tax=Papaver nudicaule TaxID=74823 RepID=A0AA41RUQ9_PAPNU|nr:hypothetical protein [Papaver nudicaule]
MEKEVKDITSSSTLSSSSSSGSLCEIAVNLKKKQQEKDPREYHLLYNAAIIGDWKSATDLIKDDPSAKTAIITADEETALHIAAAEGHSIFVHRAASAKIAEFLVNKNSKLTQIRCTLDVWVSLMHAANYATSSSKEKKEIVKYLLNVTTNDYPEPFLETRQLIYVI